MALRSYLIFITIIYFFFLDFVYYTLPMPLKAYNDHYPFLSNNILENIFMLYPYINVLPVIILLFNKSLCKLFSFTLLIVQLFYLLKLLIYIKCPTCASSGFIPTFDILSQTILVGLIATITLIYKPSDKVKPEK